MDPLSLEIGQALRRVRRSRGLTLQAVAALSRGEFKATSVAGYERGERAITLERFCRLCELYALSPDRLLADIVRTAGSGGEVQVDLTVLESLGAEGSLLSGFVRQVLSLRHEPERSSIALRSGDLDVIATASGKRPEDLIEALRPVLHKGTDEEPNGRESSDADRPDPVRHL